MPEDAGVPQKAPTTPVPARHARRGGVRQTGRFPGPEAAGESSHAIEAYLGAGFAAGAKRELEAAREIAPRDDRITELSKRLK
jgi:hypothetical protein